MHAMRTTVHAGGFDSLLPIVILILFFAVPYVLKLLGRQARPGSDQQDGPGTQTFGEPYRTDEHDEAGPPAAPDAERYPQGMPENKPIHPRWF
jgi:hypothetical protein